MIMAYFEWRFFWLQSVLSGFKETISRYIQELDLNYCVELRFKCLAASLGDVESEISLTELFRFRFGNFLIFVLRAVLSIVDWFIVLEDNEIEDRALAISKKLIELGMLASARKSVGRIKYSLEKLDLYLKIYERGQNSADLALARGLIEQDLEEQRSSVLPETQAGNYWVAWRYADVFAASKDAGDLEKVRNFANQLKDIQSPCWVFAKIYAFTRDYEYLEAARKIYESPCAAEDLFERFSGALGVYAVSNDSVDLEACRDFAQRLEWGINGCLTKERRTESFGEIYALSHDRCDLETAYSLAGKNKKFRDAVRRGIDSPQMKGCVHYDLYQLRAS